MPLIHIIGAGLAGLAAAVALTRAGHRVTLYESGPAAGGRCRSYFDRDLGCRLDNGNHLLLSGNRATLDYLATTDAAATLTGPARPIFPFMDLATGERWTVAPNLGRIPWWVLSPSRRVPGARLRDYAALARLRFTRGDASVATVLDGAGALYRRLLQPLAVAALNTPPDTALARLLAAVVNETLAQGGAACRPLVPAVGLSESFIDPALAWLSARGGTLHTGRRVAALAIDGGAVRDLLTTDGPAPVGPGEAVVMAVPPWVAPTLLPGLVAPDAHETIINVHFRTQAAPIPAGFIGLVGGMAEWVFVKDGIVATTTSAANRVVDQPAEALAATSWADTARALALPDPMPPWRVVKEKRATFAATAAQERRRPGPRTALSNLVLAGDWTATGLPATIEGAIRSGNTAAALLSGPRMR
ncbi:MAG: FAD-dependent oxidoreductase [Acetobacteraceae bacterium]|nr:FAD-dependent oxidoreductase [Acetobacteraceae bacterium]